MERLDFTLLSDGSSDAVLIQPLTWLLEQHVLHLGVAVNGTWADLRRLRRPPRDIRERIERALDLYPCDILFIHRDGESVPLEQRIEEILSAVEGVDNVSVPVVTVRMQEAWLLIDASFCRRSGSGSSRIRVCARVEMLANGLLISWLAP